MAQHWRGILKPILAEKIQEAVAETLDRLKSQDEDLPWLGDNFEQIMADAAICVLLGMADMEKFMAENGLLVVGEGEEG